MSYHKTEPMNQFILDNFSLEGKRGIVTGGSSGLGKDMAITLAKAGAQVFVFSRTGNFKEDVQESLPNITHIAVDILKSDECKSAVKEIGKDRLDFLINNAGITKRVNASACSESDWEEIQNTNSSAAFKMCQYAFPFLKTAPGAGRIINIASMAAHLGFEEVVPYCTSKSAIAGLTRGLSVEWAKHNILINSVSPGWFPSEMLQQVMDDERRDKIINRMPLHRFGLPDELSGIIWFLLSKKASYITGQDFAVDGGALAYGY